ncbi:MAG: hypothetical protein LBU22_05785, partial [Dysgonamonadaceae bacterium]|nr:hypothetical protein [Dysgonamonadaceae bacterium]
MGNSATQLIPPYTPYLPSYYSGIMGKLRVTLLNLDMQQPTLNVYLRMRITSFMVEKYSVKITWTATKA